jgi:hypothetical protein
VTRAVLCVLLAACSQPARHVRERDDDRAGAIAAPSPQPDSWKVGGSLDGPDDVDWIRIELPPEPGQLALTLVAESARFEVYDREGRRLATTKDQTIVENVANVVYVRVAGSGGTYGVVAMRRAMPPRDPKSCDRDAFDPANPACAGKCDYKHPDENNLDCCELWRRCKQIYPAPKCAVEQIWWDGDLVVMPRGRTHGIHGHPTAILHLDKPEPRAATEDVQRKRGTIKLELSDLADGRSTWSLVDARAHDLAWIHAHAKSATIEWPLQCR